MIIFGCILLFFIFLLCLKATLVLEYKDELSLTLRVLFIKIDLLGEKKKRHRKSMSARKAKRIRKKLRKKAIKQREEEEKEKKEQASGKKRVVKKRTVGDLLDIVRLITAVAKVVIKKTFGHLRLKMSRVHVRIATGDAASTAILYGAVSQSLNVLFALLDEVKRVKLPEESDVNVSADFLSEKSEVDVKIAFSLRVWHILHIACAAIIKLIKKMIENEKKKTGR